MAPYLFASKVLKRERIVRYGDGSSARDYTYIQDIVSGVLRAVQRPNGCQVDHIVNHVYIDAYIYIYIYIYTYNDSDKSGYDVLWVMCYVGSEYGLSRCITSAMIGR